jgi:tRNA G18 (ribose-2'-O)-methylase SpoU
MRLQADHRRRGIFVAESDKVVRRLLESHFEVVSLLLPEKWLREFGPLLDQRPEPEIHAFTADKPLLEQLAGFTMYQGVLAVGRIPHPPTVQELIARAAPPRLFVAVESLTNAENLGALVRNCAAFGVQALLVGETCASPFLRRAVRGSMGGIFHVPALEVVSLVETLRELGRQGIRCVAAHPHASSQPLAQSDLAGDCCLVFGSEGYGLSAPVLAGCDTAAAIPMSNAVDSLNVGSAAAICLYETWRQRRPG